jgi:EAL domain-containing protein (putative c-di-GMP-specific phosphodiesterase class I)
MLDEPDKAAVVNATVHLAHALDLVVVAEGVESQAALDALRALGCDVVQGFWTGRPMDAAAIAAVLDAAAPPA